MAPLILLLISTLFTEIAPWTIDLPEVRKQFFEKQESNDKNVITFDNNKVKVDNINLDSPMPSDYPNNYRSKMPDVNENYREEDFYGERYANDYRDESYMEKKVSDIVNHGSAYLEGLRLAVEAYEELLKNCSKMDFTTMTPPPSSVQPIPPSSTSPPPQLTRQQCSRAEQAREHVRRLAELAVWATRELQERAYARNYDDHDHEDGEDIEETELLLKLALFLDRLAYLTGFEPKPDQYITEPPTRTTTTTPQPPSLALVPIPQPIVQFYSNCIKNSSSDLPAPDRCALPGPLPDELVRLFSLTQPSTTAPTSTPNAQPNNPEPASSIPSEAILPAETITSSFTDVKTVKKRSVSDISMGGLTPVKRRSVSDILMSGMTPVKSIKKGSESDISMAGLTPVKSVKKRSLNGNPVLYFMKYFAKHKVWSNDNSEMSYSEKTNDYHVKKFLGNDAFDVKNDLDEKGKEENSRKRRSVKKFEHLRLPEDPFQDLSNYVKHKNGVNYVPNNKEVDEIKRYLQKLSKSNLIGKTHLKNLQKLLKKISKRSIDDKVLPLNSIKIDKIQTFSAKGKVFPGKSLRKLQKRSLHYEKPVLPEVSRNPQGDISYYVKNKEGTDLNPNPVQTAQARAGLEQIFQSGNIEIVHRYGSRGPVYTNAIGQGALRTYTDIL